MRIGFLALSGIRACDPEPVALGLTLPGVLERSKVVAALPSLGLLTLAGMTPREHELAYVEVTDPKRLDALPTGFDLVAISSLSAQIKDAAHCPPGPGRAAPPRGAPRLSPRPPLPRNRERAPC
jgi:hypothetical protein